MPRRTTRWHAATTFSSWSRPAPRPSPSAIDLFARRKMQSASTSAIQSGATTSAASDVNALSSRVTR
jgi:hypothetical protein